jgi:hypothetical protein
VVSGTRPYRKIGKTPKAATLAGAFKIIVTMWKKWNNAPIIKGRPSAFGLPQLPQYHIHPGKTDRPVQSITKN